jgi:hypothetical protein
LLRRCGQASFNGIQVNILADLRQVCVILDPNGAEAALEQGAIALAVSVHGLGEPARQLLHRCRQAGLGRVQQEMVMVRQDAVGMHLDAMLDTRVPQLKEKDPGSGVIENARMVDAAVHDMVPGTFMVGARFAPA